MNTLKIEYVPDVIDANGNGNLLPRNIKRFTEVLISKGATHIFILTDLDYDVCITKTKERINPLPDHTLVLSIRAIESWFLSDTVAIRQYLGDTKYYCDIPQSITNPYEEIRKIKIRISSRGVRTKPILAKAMVSCGFSIVKAAQHANCNSAKYFLNKINAFSQGD